jgi:hypothetical protein
VAEELIMYAKNVAVHVVMVQLQLFVATTGKERLCNEQELSNHILHLFNFNKPFLLHLQQFRANTYNYYNNILRSNNA